MCAQFKERENGVCLLLSKIKTEKDTESET